MAWKLAKSARSEVSSDLLGLDLSPLDLLMMSPTREGDIRG